MSKMIPVEVERGEPFRRGLGQQMPVKHKKKINLVRRERNEEIMQGFFLKHGFVRLRVLLQIRDTDGQYAGWHGASMTCDFDSIKSARGFRDKLQKFIEGGEDVN